MISWRLFRIDFCIQPSFWFMNALWAWLMAGPLAGKTAVDRELLIFIVAWILCTLVSVMVHELGHVVTGRIFGQPGNITITGLGGQAVGSYDALATWQRILVIMAGPIAGFGLVGIVVAVDAMAWNGFMGYLIDTTGSTFWEQLKPKREHFLILQTPWGHLHNDGNVPYVLTITLLTFINLFVNIMNLLPIIPMDGGMIFKEICCFIAPRAGLKFAFGCSFLVACLATVFFLIVVLERHGFMPKMIEKYYPFGLPEFSLCVFGMMAFQCLQTYRQLSAMERHALFSQRDD